MASQLRGSILAEPPLLRTRRTKLSPRPGPKTDASGKFTLGRGCESSVVNLRPRELMCSESSTKAAR